MRRAGLLFGLLSLSSVLSTDLVAVYKHDVLLLRNVDQVTNSDIPMSWESHVLRVPQPFSYPVGVTYDSEGRRLFVTEVFHEDSKVFSLSLDDDYNVKKMKSVVKTTNNTIMEELTYDPRTGNLYWTDSYNHGVYKSWVPSDEKKNPTPYPEPAHMLGNVTKPRGIAIDYCNELMYWSEQDASGKNSSSIEVCDLQGFSHTKIQQNDGKDKILYQGLTYDIMGGKLLWAETIGAETIDDVEKSHCRIVSYEFVESAPHHEVLVNLENCYPFSLTIDENYIYWADWGQQGIMRASRKNKNDIVKLVHTPQIESKYGNHHGVYGLSILGGPTEDSLQETCKGKSISQGKILLQQQDSPAVNKSPKIKDNESLKIPSQIKDKESLKEKELMQTGSNGGNTDANEQKSVDAKQSEDHPEKINEAGYFEDNQPKKKSKDDDSRDSYSEKNETEDFEDNHGDVDGNSHEANEKPLDEANETPLNRELSNETPVNRGHSCIEGPLLIVVIVLAVFCTVFMLSTTFLAYKLCFQLRKDSYKVELPTTVSEKATEVKPRQPKRFGPKNKSAVCGGSSHTQGAGNDGVRINIEDCCQMTLCDTPCYTTVKKEGRGYKCSIISPRSCNDDKQGLLDDNDDLSNF